MEFTDADAERINQAARIIKANCGVDVRPPAKLIWSAHSWDDWADTCATDPLTGEKRTGVIWTGD